MFLETNLKQESLFMNRLNICKVKMHRHYIIVNSFISSHIPELTSNYFSSPNSPPRKTGGKPTRSS